MNRLLLVFICLVFAGTAFAQQRLDGFQNNLKLTFEDPEEDEWEEDDERGWSFALNLGVYQASKKSANIYNGLCGFDVSDDPNGVRCYTIKERLFLNSTNSNSPYQTLLQYFANQGQNYTAVDIPYDAYPTNMRYNPAFMFGANMLYNFNYSAGVIIEANFMQLKAVDVYTLRGVGGQQCPNGDCIEIFSIWGEEQRFNVNLGYRGRMEINRETKWYMDLGASILGARLERNVITAGDRDYDLIIGADNPAQIIQYRPKTDIGIGGFIGTGVEMVFNDNIRMDLGLQGAREKLILQTYEGQVWNWMLVARFGI